MASDSINILQALASLALVIGLMFGFAYALKYFGLQGKFVKNLKSGSRLKIVETCYIDPKHKCVIVKRDNIEHLLLISAESARVIETIKPEGTSDV